MIGFFVQGFHLFQGIPPKNFQGEACETLQVMHRKVHGARSYNRRLQGLKNCGRREPSSSSLLWMKNPSEFIWFCPAIDSLGKIFPPKPWVFHVLWSIPLDYPNCRIKCRSHKVHFTGKRGSSFKFCCFLFRVTGPPQSSSPSVWPAQLLKLPSVYI